jgi:hypothetical protein
VHATAFLPARDSDALRVGGTSDLAFRYFHGVDTPECVMYLATQYPARTFLGQRFVCAVGADA